MLDVFQTIAKSIFPILLPFTLFTQTPTPTPTSIPVSTNTIIATGSYSYQGYSINMTMEIPKDGGEVSGTIEGDCNGGIKGIYEKEKEEIEAKAMGTCSALFITADARASIDGKVLSEQRKVEVEFEGRAEEFTHTGKLILIFQ